MSIYWLIVGSLVLALVGGTVLAVRSPAFWIGMVKAAIASAIPAIYATVTKRASPEEEAQVRDAERRGQGDEYRRRKNRNLKG